MCLTCKFYRQSLEEKKQLFSFKDLAESLNTTEENLKSIPGSKTGNYLKTFDNKTIELTIEQLNEIIENAYYILTTGVDTMVTIWAIQWNNDYIVKTL